jgi:hypothetical protein
MLPEVHTTLAQLKLAEFDRQEPEGTAGGIELNSSYATAYHWYGLLLSTVGRFDEAIAVAKLAGCLDPLSAILARDLGLVPELSPKPGHLLLRLLGAEPVPRGAVGR